VFWEGQNGTGYQNKGKSISVCIYFMNNDVELWKLSDFCRTNRYMFAVNDANFFVILIC
jgi:hypothetical protein